MKNLEQIIDKSKDLINKTRLKTFTQVPSTRESGIVIYKYDEPLHSEDIQIKKSQSYPLFDMYSLSSLSIIFSYMFVFENKQFKVHDKYFHLKRPSVRSLDYLSGIELSYQSKYINIFVSQEGAALVSANKLFEVVTQDMVRRSKGNSK